MMTKTIQVLLNLYVSAETNDEQLLEDLNSYLNDCEMVLGGDLEVLETFVEMMPGPEKN
jgi:hypothetical protein